MDDQQNESWLERNKTVFIVLGSFLILAIVIILIFLAIRMVNQAKTASAPPVIAPAATTTIPVQPATSTVTLPAIGETEKNNIATGTAAAEQLAEKASFGSFYHPTSSKIVLRPANFALPFNAKTEVANYYDIDRKMSLDDGLGSLNRNGFAVLENPFSAEADDFFSAYAALDARQVPTLITGDFLIYYYQNVLKLAYQEVESTVFYDNLWAADQRLYQVAKQRYEARLDQKGSATDVALDASRLELAYFATALVLLAPTDNQISAATGLNGSTNFSSVEASQFSIQLPAYLQDDVNAEVKLIRAANSAAKSPVLLYQRDYKSFAVPETYQSNARLNNFYLASRWLNSVFPLYYQNAACPACLLDQDDWRINFSAAFLIAADLSADQDLQNRWAKIYKLQSFFSGLRGDLNYLNYEQVFNETFAGQADIARILQSKPADNDANLSLLQNKLAAVNFSALVGGLSKTATATKPLLGFKMLTDSYWPDDYIFSQLAYPAVGKFLGSDADAQKTATACQIPGQTGFYRCVASADDILNLLQPPGNVVGNDYFAANSDYQYYGRQALGISRMLADFTVDSWHDNSYWTTWDISDKFLRAPELAQVGVMDNSAWQEKNRQTALSAWANLELPPDSFAPYQGQDASRLNQTTGNVTPLYRYIEPDLTLNRELVFDSRMIIQMLTLLNVGDGENTVLTDLKTMEKNLEGTEAIIEKELQNQALSDEDYALIADFTHAFSASAAVNKSFKLNPVSGGGSLTEDLSGIKFL
ncbi:MAG TPA: DUF3160 domain-containing protein, partial [Candidatus Nanoarchaeia archaeon]|nr:DUF3160 domain-containing protein [Candidatus Nanoarchaeia archaeon]